jgi:hypothetical protein
MRGVLAVLCFLVTIPAGGAVAQDYAARQALTQPFDARPLDTTEKRLLQIGLKVFAKYVGLIDGAWGGRSQRALEAHAASVFSDTFDPEVGPLGYHAAIVADGTLNFLSSSGLRYRTAPGAPVSFIGPARPFAREELWPRGPSGQVLRWDRTAVLIAPSRASEVGLEHEVYRDLHNGPGDPYTVRNPTRLVTSVTVGGVMIYVRSEPNGGTWHTAMVLHPADGDLDLFRLVTASLTWDSFVTTNLPWSGLLQRMMDEIDLLVAMDELRQPEAAAPVALPAPAPDAPEAGISESTGTAFYVNNVDMVTAAHVIDRCNRLTLVDGAELRVVARHATLDLALLTSDRRSRAWLSLDRTGEGRLGQKVYALGYPFYGMTGTSLNLTAGNVSAERGIGDRETEISITAAVQPGNSGGPLLSRDGAIIGVVIAKLSAGAMLEAAGILPENVNFAVRGAELLAFLDVNAVLYPRGVAEPFDLEDGVPGYVQDAIVPVVCHRTTWQ